MVVSSTNFDSACSAKRAVETSAEISKDFQTENGNSKYTVAPMQSATRSRSGKITQDRVDALRVYMQGKNPGNWKRVAKDLSLRRDLCSEIFWSKIATEAQKKKRAEISNKSKFSDEEKIAIRKHYDKYGSTRWPELAKKFGNTRPFMKYYSFFWGNLATEKEIQLRKNNKKSRKNTTLDKVDALRVYMQGKIPGNWKRVAEDLSLPKEFCRRNFWSQIATEDQKKMQKFYHFNNMVFSNEEKIAIRKHYDKYGSTRWADLAKRFGNIRAAPSYTAHFWRFLATEEEIKLKQKKKRKIRKADNNLNIEESEQTKNSVNRQNFSKAADVNLHPHISQKKEYTEEDLLDFTDGFNDEVQKSRVQIIEDDDLSDREVDVNESMDSIIERTQVSSRQNKKQRFF